MTNEEIQNTPVDVEHELPQGDASDDTSSAQPSEIDKLKSENALYLDRLARLQAEFENFRKRSQREQQEFRDYALTDTLKQLLPILDSLDRALKVEGVSSEDFRSGSRADRPPVPRRADAARRGTDCRPGAALRSQPAPGHPDGGDRRRFRTIT